MEKIETKIETLKAELHTAYTVDDLSLEGLELKMLSTKELLETGFIEKNLKRIICVKDADAMTEVCDYFDKECYSVLPNEIEPIYDPTELISFGDYIKHIKYGVVRGVVKNKIIDFIDILKKGEYKPGTDERNDEEFGF